MLMADLPPPPTSSVSPDLLAPPSIYHSSTFARYNKPYIMAIKNNPRGYAGPKAEVVIYMVTEYVDALRPAFKVAAPAFRVAAPAFRVAAAILFYTSPNPTPSAPEPDV